MRKQKISINYNLEINSKLPKMTKNQKYAKDNNENILEINAVLP